jgi:hypothetical protein
MSHRPPAFAFSLLLNSIAVLENFSRRRVTAKCHTPTHQSTTTQKANDALHNLSKNSICTHFESHPASLIFPGGGEHARLRSRKPSVMPTAETDSDGGSADPDEWRLLGQKRVPLADAARIGSGV